MAKVFANPPVSSVVDKRLKPISAEKLQKVVTFEIDRAVDFIESEISGDRVRADLYYQGKTSITHVPGRSKVVVTKVRDVVKSVLPSIARIFTQTDKIGVFESDDEEDEKMCKDATLYCNNVFNRYGGYVAFIEAVTDALKAKIGVITVGFEKKQVASHETTNLLTPQDLADMEGDSSNTVTEVSDPTDVPQPDGSTIPMQQAVVTRAIYKDCWTIICMPPETFIVSPEATCVQDARMHGFRYMEKIYNLTAMGISYETIIDSGIEAGDEQLLDQEKTQRDGFDYTDDDDAPVEDPSARECLFCNIWLRIDADGDGIPELRHIQTVGTKYVVVLDEPTHYTPNAVFKSELTPHTMFPISLAEDLEQDQDAMTALLRSILDNCALVNSPRTEINEQMVNLVDAKNTEIGTMIRVKQMGQINELTTPFVAGETLPVLQVLNDMSEARSGVTKMSQGLNPDALQSSPRMAANAAVQNADARIEMMARNIAETGAKELLMALLRCAMYDKNGAASVKEDGQYTQIDTSAWHDSVSVTPKVGLGNGRTEERKEALGGVIGMITQSIQQYGLSNPMSGYTQLRNAVKDLIRLSGLSNVSDYFPAVPPQQLQQIDQQRAQAAQAAQQQPDPTQGLVAAEKIKGQVKMQVEGSKMQQQSQLKLVELQQKDKAESQRLATKTTTDVALARMEDDRQRDKQDADFAVAAVKAGLDAGTKRQVAAQQAKVRTPANG